MAAFFQDFFFHLIERSDVDVNFPDFHPSGLLRATAVEFQNIAGFQDKNLVLDGRQFLGEGGVQVQLAVITVNGNEVSRADEVQHELQFFDARVSRDVQPAHLQCDSGNLEHATADEAEAAAELLGKVGDQL